MTYYILCICKGALPLLPVQSYNKQFRYTRQEIILMDHTDISSSLPESASSFFPGHFSLSRNMVKLLAVLAMTGNHIARVFLLPGSLLSEALTGLGYMAAITMCYLLVEGFHTTSHLCRYAIRLFIFGLIAQGPYYALFGISQANNLFTLLLCMAIIHIMNKPWPDYFRYAAILLLFLASGVSEWGFYLPLCAVFFEECRQGKRSLKTTYPALVFLFFVMEIADLLMAGSFSLFSPLIAAIHTSGPAVSAILIVFFYGIKAPARRTAFSRWFFYVYYPAHLCLLLLISRLLQKP